MCDFVERMNSLTPQEKKICTVIQQKPSLTIRGIGREVGLKHSTIQFHLYNAYNKLGVSTRAELVANLCKSKTP